LTGLAPATVFENPAGKSTNTSTMMDRKTQDTSMKVAAPFRELRNVMERVALERAVHLARRLNRQIMKPSSVE
jgi:hypothetical protein